MNKVELSGYIFKIEERQLSSGKTLTNIVLKEGKKPHIQFHKIQVWEHVTDIGQGDYVFVKGALKNSSWKKKDGTMAYQTAVNAFEVVKKEFQDNNATPSLEASPSDDDVFDEDVPF